MKKALIIFCFVILVIHNSFFCFAASKWPPDVDISADGGILMDAETGTILSGKNIYEKYYPASITKILTAIVVLEKCSLDEKVSFSHNAIFDVEANSKNANLAEGDTLTVKECLYVLLLHSANEVANALAEHVSGSKEAFADLMNQKAIALGCVNSNFVNPSGLNDPNHYTCAFDMAQIAKEAYRNKTFLEIDSTVSYKIPPTKNNPNGKEISIGSKMLKKNWPEYDPRAYAGKTGYTSLAGNTLVTFAKKDNLNLIAVILNGHATHYADTKLLLDFGFENFMRSNMPEVAYDPLTQDLTFDKIKLNKSDDVQIRTESNFIVVPKGTDISEVEKDFSNEVSSVDPQGTFAKVNYSYLKKQVGTAFIYLDIDKKLINDKAQESYAESVNNNVSNKKKPDLHSVNDRYIQIAGILIVMCVIIIIFYIWKIQRRGRHAELHLKRIKNLCKEDPELYNRYLEKYNANRKPLKLNLKKRNMFRKK